MTDDRRTTDHTMDSKSASA